MFIVLRSIRVLFSLESMVRGGPLVVIDGINNFYKWPKVNGKNWGYKPVIRSIDNL